MSPHTVTSHGDVHNYHNTNDHMLQGQTVVSLYIGMAGQQHGGSNRSIINNTAITLLGAGFTHFNAPTCPFRMLLWPARTSPSPEIIAKVAN